MRFKKHTKIPNCNNNNNNNNNNSNKCTTFKIFKKSKIQNERITATKYTSVG